MVIFVSMWEIIMGMDGATKITGTGNLIHDKPLKPYTN